MKFESQCIHAGYQPKNGEACALPIVQSTTFRYESTAEVAKLFDLRENGFFYTRLGNPTMDAVEQKIAALEGGVGALLGPGSCADRRRHHLQSRRSHRSELLHLRRHFQPARRDAEALRHQRDLCGSARL